MLRPLREVIEELYGSGLSLEQQVLVGELIAAATAQRQGELPLTPRQARNKRYYEGNRQRLKASEKRLNGLNQDASEETPSQKGFPIPLPKNSTPENPPKKTPPLGEQKKGSRLPENWHPTDVDWQWAQTDLELDAELLRFETGAFRDFFWAAPGQKGCKLNWSLAWRNWMREALRRGRKGHGPPKQHRNGLADALDRAVEKAHRHDQGRDS